MLFAQVLLYLSLSSLISAQSNGDVRLVDGPRPYEGRLEIFLQGKWGTFCGSDKSKFSRGAAVAACKQLGYDDQDGSGSVNQLDYAKEAPSGTPMHIGSAYCDYSFAVGELHILRCDISEQLSPSECAQSKAIGLRCNNVSLWIPSQSYGGAVRTSSSLSHQITSKGVLEVYLNEVWGNVCGASGFDQQAADSACRQMGYTNAASFRTDSAKSQATVWLNGVTCGGATSCDCLSRCYDAPNSPSLTCGKDNSVYIECTFDLSLKTLATSGNIDVCTNGRKGKCSGPKSGGGGGGGGHQTQSLSPGAIAGIVVGVCAFCAVTLVVVTAAIVSVLYRWRKSASYDKIVNN